MTGLFLGCSRTSCVVEDVGCPVARICNTPLRRKEEDERAAGGRRSRQAEDVRTVFGDVRPIIAHNNSFYRPNFYGQLSIKGKFGINLAPNLSR